MKFYELRRNIQRPTLVCARHFAIKCFDSRSVLTMRKGTLNVCVLKGDRLNGDDDREEVKLNAPVGSLLSTTYDLIFTHPEVVVDNKKVFKLLKTPLLYRR